MSSRQTFLPTLAGLGLLAIVPGLGWAADPSPSAPPDQVPAEVSVADLGESSSLDPSIPYSATLVPLLASASGPPPLAAPDQVGVLVYPLAAPAVGVDPWGWRYSESKGRWRMHTGLDLMAPRGTPVLAALAGRVHLVQWIDGYGLTVVLDHGDGRRSLYGHLDAVAVRPGQVVRGGESLAVVGMTGRTSGPHLHFEWRTQQGSAWVAHDPTPLLPVARPSPLLASELQRLRALGQPETQTLPLSFSVPPPQPPPLLASDAAPASH